MISTTTLTPKRTFDVNMDSITDMKPDSYMTDEARNDLTDDMSEEGVNNDVFLFEISLESRNLSLKFNCNNVPIGLIISTR